MKRYGVFLIIVLGVISLAGCAGIVESSPAPAIPPTATEMPVLPSPTALPPTPAQPTVAFLPTATILPTPIEPVPATTSVDNLILRSGPGFLFENLAVYKENSTVTILGKSQGDAWYYVVTSKNVAGWMKSDYLILQGEDSGIPYLAFPDANRVVGHVRTADGIPASGIGVLISPASGYHGTDGDNTMTDSTGTFYFFLPPALTGDYMVQVNGNNCAGNLVIGKCELPYQLPAAVPVTLPMDSSVTIEFVLQHN